MSENPLIGTWKLISYVALRNNGTRVPVYGRSPVGRLTYDAQGNMSVQIMRQGRSLAGAGSDPGLGGELPDDLANGYQAYFSTYQVDTARRTIHHAVLGSLYPGWTGSIQVRYFEMQSPDRLLLRSAPFESQPVDNPIFELLWERLADVGDPRARHASAFAHR